ncbi:MAG: sensor histidine kinase [Lachnospiraceae bacterium]|nr:sensor histidine kinase [Lachnospiraceae bacterium]
MKEMNKKIRYYFSNYKFNSVFFKNLTMILGVVMIPIVGILFLGYYSCRNMQQNEIRVYSEKSAENILTEVNRILTEAKTELLYFGGSTDIRLYLYDSQLDQYYYKINKILELMTMPIIAKDYVDSVFVYAASSETVIDAGKGALKYENYENREIIEYYLNQKDEKRKFCVVDNNVREYLRKQLVVFCDVYMGKEIKGLFAMSLDQKELLEELDIPEKIDFCITENGSVILSSDMSLLEKNKEEIAWFESGNETVIKENHCITSLADEGTGLEIIMRMDIKNYQDQLSYMRGFVFVFLLVIMWASFGFAVIISIRLFQPIERIASSIQQYTSVLTGEKEMFLEKNELEYILKSIQKTVNAKQDIEQELLKRIELLKKAQAVALQSQINPHFLNNALETINWTARDLLGNQNEISEMVELLSKMFRMALESTDIVVPLQTEIEHCKCYLKLQAKRYEDKFEVIWDIEPNVYEYKIIRIVLQPLLENAIYHGIKPLSGRGTITIRGRVRNDRVELSVIDNGMGMTREQFEKLQVTMKQEEIKESTHIGLSNVNQRLKLYFGEEYEMEIESKISEGTSVTIRITGEK